LSWRRRRSPQDCVLWNSNLSRRHRRLDF
jgi:hypothetical protein